MKFETMKLDQLIAVRAQIEAEIDIRIARQRSQLIEAIGELHKTSSTVSSPARGRKPHPLKGNKLPPRYGNPKNPAETWAGRGNRPRWLTAALKGGKKLEAFAIR